MVAARVHTPGWLIYTREADRRVEAARIVAAVAPRPNRAKADPFAAYTRTSQACRENAIDAAFAL